MFRHHLAPVSRSLQSYPSLVFPSRAQMGRTLLAHSQGLHEEVFSLTLFLSPSLRMEWVAWLMSLGEKMVCGAQSFPSPSFWEQRWLQQQIFYSTTPSWKTHRVGSHMGRLVGGHFRGAKLLSSGFNIGKPTVDTYLSCLLNMSFLDNKDRILNSSCHSLFPISHNIFSQRYRPK